MEKKYPIIVPLDLDEEDMRKVRWLMKRWGLDDEQDALRRVIAETAKRIRQEDRDAGKGER